MPTAIDLFLSIQYLEAVSNIDSELNKANPKKIVSSHEEDSWRFMEHIWMFRGLVKHFWNCETLARKIETAFLPRVKNRGRRKAEGAAQEVDTFQCLPLNQPTWLANFFSFLPNHRKVTVLNPKKTQTNLTRLVKQRTSTLACKILHFLCFQP